MAKFDYNNPKNASTNYMLFKLNCGYHSQVSDEENLDPHSQSKNYGRIIFQAPKSDDRLSTKFLLCPRTLKASQQ